MFSNEPIHYLQLVGQSWSRGQSRGYSGPDKTGRQSPNQNRPMTRSTSVYKYIIPQAFKSINIQRRLLSLTDLVNYWKITVLNFTLQQKAFPFDIFRVT